MTINFSRVISPSLSPNTDSRDVLAAWKILLQPWGWKEGRSLHSVNSWLTHYFGQEPVLFNSGRGALLAILTAFDIGSGDEVLIQAFTCVAVPNSVLWAGAKPVYVDIDETLNMDPDSVEKNISKKTKAMIIQHTFGVPAQLDRLIIIAKRHNLVVIEDCAHSLGATYKGKKVGSLGDAAFFSFGRDKVVSSVWGGAAMVNAKCQMPNAKLKLKQFQKKLSYPSSFWIFQQLLHPIAFSLVLASYNLLIGKILLVLLQRLHLLSFPVYPEEKRGDRPKEFPLRYPNALATLLVLQLEKLDRMNAKRVNTVRYYSEALSLKSSLWMPSLTGGAVYLRYPVRTDNPEKLIKRARDYGMLLGNWYHNIIDPDGVNFHAVGYPIGSCPRAEEAAKNIINLPTLLSSADTKRITTLFW